MPELRLRAPARIVRLDGGLAVAGDIASGVGVTFNLQTGSIVPLSGVQSVAGNIQFASAVAHNVVRTVGPVATGVLGVTGNISSSAGTGGFWSIPTQLDEEATYNNVLGWAWTASDKTPNFATTPPAGQVNHAGDLRNNGEGDDLWNHFHQWKRTGLQLYFDWATAWRNYFVTSFMNDLAVDPTLEHTYGNGLVAWAREFPSDTAAQTTLGQIAAHIEGYANALSIGSSRLGFYGQRRYARYLIFACYYAEYNPITRWINMRNKLLDAWMASPDWEDDTVGTTAQKIRWGGQYFVYDGVGGSSGMTPATYAAGRRSFSSFSGALIAEAFWRSYLQTGRTDVRNRIIAMARFAYYYNHQPDYINPMVGGWYGHENGRWWHNSGGFNTNPSLGDADCPYDTSQVNMLVWAYKLTGHRGYLKRAHKYLRVGTQYLSAAPNQPKQSDTEVHHYLDTDTDPDPIYFNWNKGENQYAYQVWENGGVPVVETPWPPYTVPTTPGQVTLIGTNTAAAVKPSTHNNFQWEYGCFGYYGGGAFVQDYSNGGAWVVAGSGGHNTPPNVGGLIFDFQTATWIRKDNANGIAYRANDYDASEVNGFGEIIAAPTAGIPAPAHLYDFIVALPRGLGGGNKGSVMLLKSQSGCLGNPQFCGSLYAHAFNLETGLWTRVSTNGVIQGGSQDHRMSAYDEKANRLYILMSFMTVKPFDYLDLNTMTYSQFSTSAPSGGPFTASAFVDTSRNMLVIQRDTAPYLMGIDLDNTGGGLVNLTTSGTFNGDCQYKWHYFPKDGCWYTHRGNRQALQATPNTPSNVLFKLTPPPINSNPFTGTWAYSQVTLSAALDPTPSNWSAIQSNAIHYNRFFFVPSLQCFAWICGDITKQVSLLLPP